MNRGCCSIVLVFFFIAAQTISAQHNMPVVEDDQQTKDFRNQSIDLSISFWGNSSSGVAINLRGVSVDAGTGSVSAKLVYNYYSPNYFAYYLSMGVLTSNLNIKTLSTHTSTLVPIMTGLKYYFLNLSEDNPIRPYLFGSGGILIGTESSVKLISIETHTESVIGANAGIGADIILGSLIKLHTCIGYNLFSDFKETVGNRKNYNGPEFSFGIGFMF